MLQNISVTPDVTFAINYFPDKIFFLDNAIWKVVQLVSKLSTFTNNFNWCKIGTIYATLDFATSHVDW